jgi:hypothetical protein
VASREWYFNEARLKKYIALGILSAIGYNSMAQAEPTSKDSIRALAYTNLKDVFASGFYFESVQHNQGWTPLLCASISADMNIEFNEKYVLNAQTAHMANNYYNSEQLKIYQDAISANLYAKTRSGNFGIKVGNFLANPEYSPLRWEQDMSLHGLMMGIYGLNMATWVPKGAIFKWQNKGNALSAGYVEEGEPGFRFNGEESSLLLSGEKQFFNGKLSTKASLRINEQETGLDLHAVGSLGKNFEMMANVLKLGTNQPSYMLIERLSCDKVTFTLTKVYQVDGFSAAIFNISTKKGAYAGISIIYNDLLRQDQKTYAAFRLGYIIFLNNQKQN